MPASEESAETGRLPISVCSTESRMLRALAETRTLPHGLFSPSRLLNLPRAACCRGHSSSRCLMAGRRNRGYGCMDCGHAAIHFTIMQREDAMGSRKRSARAKERTEFFEGLGGMDDVFAKEDERERRQAEEQEEARRYKACSRSSATIHARSRSHGSLCAAHGRGGLQVYRCSYCGGWHLTSHPWKEA